MKGRQNKVELCVGNDRILSLGQRRLGVGQSRRRRTFPVLGFGETRPEEGLLVVGGVSVGFGRSADDRHDAENLNRNWLGPVFVRSVFFVGRKVEVVLSGLAGVGREEVARWQSQEVRELSFHGFVSPPVVLPPGHLGHLRRETIFNFFGADTQNKSGKVANKLETDLPSANYKTGELDGATQQPTTWPALPPMKLAAT